jgi:hypothetical protein
MRNRDIDGLIPPPSNGLTGYRDAVELTLDHATDGPAAALPIDPDWAGEIVYTDVRTATSAAEPAALRKAAADVAADRPWIARLAMPGRAWFDVEVSARDGGGSRYTQRATFVPKGIPGRLYWFATRPLWTLALRRLARNAVRPRTAEAVRAP